MFKDQESPKFDDAVVHTQGFIYSGVLTTGPSLTHLRVSQDGLNTLHGSHFRDKSGVITMGPSLSPGK